MTQERMGEGDERFENGIDAGDTTSVPGQTEAAFRHRQHASAELPEIRSTQLIPGPLDEHDEPASEPATVPFWDTTRHEAR